MSIFAIVLAALILDAVLGEPRWLWDRLPHPAVLIGRLIDRFERTFNSRSHGSGVILVLVLILGGLAIGLLVQSLGTVAEVALIAILLAHRSLVDHVADVARSLRMSLPSARNAVGLIVSRDCRDMTEPQIARSAIESAAENLSDGVIAPAFWALIAGVPGILIYKAINTADSMVGYRTDRFAQFGWAAARLDDVLNWVPARLTAGLLWLAGAGTARWAEVTKEAQRHKSPNAGWPEAVMARNINVALAGPRAYHGQMQDLPWVNPAARKTIAASEIDAAIGQLWKVWAIFAMVLAVGIWGT